MLQRSAPPVNAPLLAAIVLLAAAPAGAETTPGVVPSPERARALESGRELVARPSGAEASVLVEELWRSWDLVGPEPVVGPLEEVVSARGADPLVRDAASYRLACPHCRSPVEFYLDDLLQNCAHCALEVENPFCAEVLELELERIEACRQPRELILVSRPEPPHPHELRYRAPTRMRAPWPGRARAG